MPPSKNINRKTGRKKPTPKPKRYLAAPYDWDGLFEPLINDPTRNKILVQGVDFKCILRSMSEQIRRAARERGLHMSIDKEGNTLVIRRRMPR